MTEIKPLNDVDWDDEAIVDREPEGGDGKHHFGFLRLYALKVTKVFTGGVYLTIPGVTGGDFVNNERDENGLKKFKGWIVGGGQYLFVMVGIKQDKDGNDFQLVKQFPSKVKKGDVHQWGDFVLPALNKLPTVQKDKMASEGVFCEWDEIATGKTFIPDGETEAKDIKTWGNFTVHPNEASLQAASDEFFSQFNNGPSNNPAANHYPASWYNTPATPEGMIEYGRGSAGMEDGPLALELQLVDESGNPALTSVGQPVDVSALLAEVRDVPKEMVNPLG